MLRIEPRKVSEKPAENSYPAEDYAVIKEYKERFITDLIAAVKNSDDIVFISYSCIDDTEEKIKIALAMILEKFKNEDLFTPVIACIKELIANATKANAKQILTIEGHIKDPEDHDDTVRKIRSILNESALLEYGIKCKENGLSTRTFLKLSKGRLTIEVINNVPLSKSELARINDKIESSSKYDSIAEFYLENPDPRAEGMGLGISMIVVLLKNINIPYKNFTVTTDGLEKTRARIVIPLRYTAR